MFSVRPSWSELNKAWSQAAREAAAHARKSGNQRVAEPEGGVSHRANTGVVYPKGTSEATMKEHQARLVSEEGAQKKFHNEVIAPHLEKLKSQGYETAGVVGDHQAGTYRPSYRKPGKTGWRSQQFDRSGNPIGDETKMTSREHTARPGE